MTLTAIILLVLLAAIPLTISRPLESTHLPTLQMQIKTILLHPTISQQPNIQNHIIAFENYYSRPVFIVGLTSFGGYQLHTKVSSDVAGITLQLDGVLKQNIGELLITFSGIKMIKMCYLVFQEQLGNEIGLKHYSYHSQQSKISNHQQLTKHKTINIPMSLIRHTPTRQQHRHFNLTFDLNQEPSNLNIKGITLLRQINFDQNNKGLWNIIGSFTEKHIEITLLNELDLNEQFPKFSLVLVIGDKDNSAVHLQTISLYGPLQTYEKLNVSKKISFIGLSLLERNIECKGLSLINQLEVNTEGYFISFQHQDRKCIPSMQFSIISLHSPHVESSPSLVAEMEQSQWKTTTRVLLTCTGSTYPTFYQNYWLLWIDPIKRTVETCQPCPAGCLTCTFCAGCYRFLTCLSCVSGMSLRSIKLSSSTENVCRCPDGFFASAVDNKCYLCNVLHVGCGATTCTGVYTSHYTSLCTTCLPGYYGPSSISIPGWNGFTSCGSCPAGCSGCGSATSCTACFSSTQVSLSGVCYCKTALTYYNPTTKACVNCDALYTNCNTCTNTTATAASCTSCKPSFYLASTTSCMPCSSNCNTCTSTTCTSCISPYLPSGSACICDAAASMVYQTSTNTCVVCSSIVSNCASCNSGVVSCTNCQIQFYLANSMLCQPCPTTCSACSTSIFCTACKNNLDLTSSNTCQCDVANSEFLLVSINQCVLCSDYFSYCDSCSYDVSLSAVDCTSCMAGFYITTFPTKCNLCPTQCSACLNQTYCQDCNTGYLLNIVNFTCDCANCSYCTTTLLLPNCADCISGTPDICTLCTPGSYINTINIPQTCDSCPIGCATCTSDTLCSSCIYPFIPNAFSGCQCNALALQYYDQATSNCVSCNTVITLCITCLSAPYNTLCSLCFQGYYPDGQVCLPCSHPCDLCTSPTSCLTCAATFTLSSTTCSCNNAIGLFQDSISNTCVDCTVFYSSACTKCVNQIIVTSGVKCLTCIDGYFPDSSTYACSNCPQTCLTCTNSALCTVCLDSFELLNGVCACEIIAGMYPTGQECAPCSSVFDYCLGCQYINQTTTCLDCISGTYLSVDNLSCILCPPNCASCDSTGCIDCQPGFLNNSLGFCQCSTSCSTIPTADVACLECSQATNSTTSVTILSCLACSPSYYNLANETCPSCPSTCLTCITYLQCELCQPSYTLIGGACVCDSYKHQILFKSKCHGCSFFIRGCSTCALNVTVVSCKTCQQGYVLVGTTCNACPIGCLSCTALNQCSKCMLNHVLTGGACNYVAICDPVNAKFYDTTTGTCQLCHPLCKVCTSYNYCITCITSINFLTNILGKCSCPSQLGYFLNDVTGHCVDCLTLPFLDNCKYCSKGIIATQSENIICVRCDIGYYLDNGVCTQCQSGCIQCVDGISCCSCFGPKWIMDNSACVCNKNENYFANNASDCQLCTLVQCSICSTLTTCVNCNFGYFVNNMSVCQLAVCGNGAIEGNQLCDDGNTTDGNGCDSTCNVELFYFCYGSPSVCTLDSRFNVAIDSIIVECNKIHYNFVIYPYESSYENGIYNNFLVSQDLTLQNLISWKRTKGIITYTYEITKNIQNLTVEFVFDAQYLGISETSTFPRNTLTFAVEPTNNMKALYYDPSVCQSKKLFQAVQNAIQYASYGTLALSALPCKIVGLQLFGVLQLGFLSMGSLDNVNMLLSPMSGAKGVNGFNLDLSESASKKRLLQGKQILTPERVASIGYKSNFIRNCNVMFLLVVSIIVVAFLLYLITFIFKNCAATIHKFTKRLIKQVLLTLILFNIFNFSYSVGLHFKYADKNDQLYLLGTCAAIATIVIPVIMALALMMSEQEGFGQFKDKLKKGCIQKGYFVITIIYRIMIGLYISTSNQDELSTLIVLAFSIFFLVYNLVNLPFVKAYHNYRANVCHFCQFICLFVIMYYRSMKSSTSDVEVSLIFAPVYLWYACIGVSLLVSMIVLFYEIYLWLKQCFKVKKSNSIKPDDKSEKHETVQCIALGDKDNHEKIIQFDSYE